ncbi:hypothetical protein SLS61_008678 [Didymella pomorum]
MAPPKKWIVNAFVEMCSGHQSPGLWRHPEDHSHEFGDVQHWVELAKLLEEAKFHGIFIADVLGGYDVYNGNLDAAKISGAQWPVNEPLSVHDERYAQAEEYVKVMYKLFESSWRDDAVVLDREKGIYTVPDRVREINHNGKYFTVPGPHICQPSPQRTPLLLQAGTSRAGKQFAAQSAEAIFVSAFSPSVPAKSIAEIRELAATQHGRDPSNIKVLALVTPIIGRTEEEAQAKLADYRKYASLDGALALFCGWTGIDLGKYGDDEELRQVESNAVRSTVEAYAKFSPGTSKWTKHTVAEHVSIGGNGPIIVGTPAQVVDGLQTWVDEADVDGFNFAYALFPQSFKDIIELLLPELRARGLFWEDYAVPGGTYRENFYSKPGQQGPLDEHIASKYRWKAGVDAKDHIIPE